MVFGDVAWDDFNIPGFAGFTKNCEGEATSLKTNGLWRFGIIPRGYLNLLLKAKLFYQSLKKSISLSNQVISCPS
ncbi:MAG: hypothetical protein DRG58_09675 [Deltaproteobacteria bacterium]|nr:MAG: hypothetical protein DRG58_09675 [Deltaproteobacteria bacterium]